MFASVAFAATGDMSLATAAKSGRPRRGSVRIEGMSKQQVSQQGTVCSGVGRDPRRQGDGSISC
jgi:hypothetical protein